MVHEYLTDRLDAFLDACERSQAPRLLLTVPPRHGKSELASVRLPAYAFGRNPDWQIIHASYTASLSNDFSRQVRNLMLEPEYQELFPLVQPAVTPASVQHWAIMGRRGKFVSTGVGGPLTGRGCHLMIIDDPVKNDQEADSEVFRQKQRNWYAATARTRLSPGAGVLLIMTRWHVADLGGYVSEGAGGDDMPAEEWERVDLPALAEDGDPLGREVGEPLWPEQFSASELDALKRQLPPRWWLALYQQRPVASEGNMLEVAKIGHHIPFVDELHIYQAWDLAISSKQTADFTVCATVGIDADQNAYLLDIDRGHWGFNETLQRVADNAETWKPVSIGIETTAYQAAAFEEAGRRYLLPFRELKPDRDKAIRAQLLADRISMGKVFANKRLPWWRVWEQEALAFPMGIKDDQVDATVYALLMAFGGPMIPTVAGVKKKKVARRTW